ncbi:MAG: GTPase ObgE [Anaerolineae bacterium]|nr:GTPase ObgE [Anaerolineae bacterium]
MFLDEATIHIKSGDGGDGLVAFRREKYVPFGGPAGGDGGKGGDVYLVVSTHLNTLTRFRYQRHFKAASGKRGGNFNRTGASGDDLFVEVPPGTIARDADTGALIADLTQDGQKIIVAQGGRGGRGNARFATSTNQAPRVAEKGEPGAERTLKLELRMIADVGFVGAPNAGKSTLLSVVSAARPKIAPYPFTTLTPNLGVVEMDHRTFVAADIPGLIEGAHLGAGLGHDFLKHIQRTRVLVHLLDGDAADPFADFIQINAELALFDEKLAEKPQLVVFNKIDLPHAQARWPEVCSAVQARGYEVMSISAVAQTRTRELVGRVFQILDELPAAEPAPVEDIPVYTVEADPLAFEIERLEAHEWRIHGKHIERAAAMTYWEYEEALARFQRILETLGIYQALIERGVQQGDIVHIGDYELEWHD